jgi:hypothetical protein
MVMMTSQSTTIATLGLDQLATVTGGAGTPSQSQAELRQLAQQHCPTTYAKFKGAPQITRAMGERCLDEAGLGMFKGRLDQYFPRK